MGALDTAMGVGQRGLAEAPATALGLPTRGGHVPEGRPPRQVR